MLIYIEDYLNRRHELRRQAEPLLVAAGGSAVATPVEPAPARWLAPVHAAVLTSSLDPDLPVTSELADLFAEASLI
jgi:hypothetical protein